MDKISKHMNQSIQKIYSNDSVENINISTLNALKNRKLLSKDNKLTTSGKRYAISKMPLPKQCFEISIELSNISLSYQGNPELALLNYYKSLGYIGVDYEGIGILTVLKALMLDEFIKCHPMLPRSSICSGYIEGLLLTNKDKINELTSSIFLTTRDKYLKNFKEIISQPFSSINFSRLPIEFAEAMYDAISKDTYIELAKKISEDSYNYRNGWPDITIIKDGKVQFIEVKTTDKLHDNQLRTIPIMRDILLCEFKVCKVRKMA